MRTQEVGYIPAENIETPFERLARLNKHRNVDLASATDDDHIQVPSKIFSSHLVKQRDALDDSGFSAHSGKLSALSRREGGASPAAVSPQPPTKPSVIFGPCSYVEHSGDELETDEDEGEDEDDEEHEDYREEEEEEEEGQEKMEEGSGNEYMEDGADHQPVGAQTDGAIVGQQDIRSRRHHEAGNAASPATDIISSKIATSNTLEVAAARRQILAGMEPDDGMEWDAREAERIQDARSARSAKNGDNDSAARTQSIAEPQRALYQRPEPADDSRQSTTSRDPGSSCDNIPVTAEQDQRLHQQRQFHAAQATEATQSLQSRPSKQQQQHRTPSYASADPAGWPPPEFRASHDSPQGFLNPSHVQVCSDRIVSDASCASSNGSDCSNPQYGTGGPYGRGSPTPQQPRKEKERRKSKNESFDASIDENGPESPKEGKKRSGVFSGLFSRKKDTKDHKSGSLSSAGVSADDSTLMLRNSEDSSRNTMRGVSPASASPSSGPTGLGRGVQERDRGAQEAYHRQFLAQSQADRQGHDGQFVHRPGGGKPRPGSLMGTPGSVPMLNVLRVFAGDDIDSDATFKTVLLNQSTSTNDLVRQAMQRFRLGYGEYQLTVKLMEGSERPLAPEEKPLQVLDRLSEMASVDRVVIPSVKRSSVGSISSVSSNLSLNPAILRANDDFSDDHAVKFYLKRAVDTQSTIKQDDSEPQGRAGVGAGGNFALNSTSEQASLWPVSSAGSYSALSGSIPRALQGPSSNTASCQGADAALTQAPQARFALRLVIFPSDLPEGLVFDPQTNALIPQEALAERGPTGAVPAEGIESRFREKILSLPRNVTVAEVVEAGLDRFGILDGLVEGGDNVEDRTNRHRSKQRIKYGLAVDVKRQGPGQERHLAPNSRVVDAYPTPPIFKTLSANKRRSTDSAMLLSMAEEQMRPTDPVFILRSVGPHSPAPVGPRNGKSTRSLSPTEGRLAEKQDQRKQSEVIAAVSSAGPTAIGASTFGAPVNSAARSREVIAAQRAAAQERKAAVLGAQRNDQQGVDLFLLDNGKIRSSRSLEGKMRYSYLPDAEGASELDISAIVQDVLSDSGAARPFDKQSPSFGNTSRPVIPRRGGSNSMLHNAYASAPSSPTPDHANTVVPRALDGDRGSQVRPDSNRDLLESFVRNPAAREDTIEARISQVLSRVAAGGTGDSMPKGNSTVGRSTPTATASALRSALSTTTHKGGSGSGSQGDVSDHSFSSVHDSSTRSASTSTEKSALTNPTPLSTIGLPGSSQTLSLGFAAATVAGSSASTPSAAARVFSQDSTRRMGNAGPAAYIPSDDFGLDHLYTIVDAASRRDPRKYVSKMISRAASCGGTHGATGASSEIATPPPTSGSSKNNSVVAVLTLAPEPEKLRPQVAGLFPPSPPLALFSEAESAANGGRADSGPTKVQQIYLPLERQLDRIEDSLDALLADVLRVF